MDSDPGRIAKRREARARAEARRAEAIIARKSESAPEAILRDTTPLPPRDPNERGTVALLDLEPHHCRYIPGDDRLFCGAPKVLGTSYCEVHIKRCLRPDVPRAQRPAYPPLIRRQQFETVS
jgi:hypothetical protein